MIHPLAAAVLALCNFQLATGSAFTVEAAAGHYGWLPAAVCAKAVAHRRTFTPFEDATNRHLDLAFGDINGAPIIGHFQ